MKGRNTLTLNHATMVAALQLWADATFKVPVRIESVEHKNRGNGDDFEVEITEPEVKL